MSGMAFDGHPRSYISLRIDMVTRTKGHDRTYLLFILPAIAWVSFFILYPFVQAIHISTTDMTLLRPDSAESVGMQNYVELFTSSEFWHSLRTTGIFTGTVVFFQFTIGLTLALVLNATHRGTGVVRTVVMLPWILPPIALGIIWAWIFRGGQTGLLNAFLLGVFGVKPTNWLGIEHALASVSVAAIWIGCPFSFMLELAGLQKIPPVLYESADVDGAGTLRKLWHITFPLMRSTFMVNLIMITVFTITYFDIVYALTKGGPQGATEVLPLYMYLEAFRDFQFGTGSAIAVVMLFLSLLLTALYLATMNRKETL
jgi:multiple sugar transport system permease protein